MRHAVEIESLRIFAGPSNRRSARFSSPAARRARRGVAVLASGALLFLLASPAAAGPDVCQRTSRGKNVTITCTGNQSAGINHSDLMNSRPIGAAPPPQPAPILPLDIGNLNWTVNNLSADIAPTGFAAGITTSLGSGKGGRSATRLDLDIDLGGRSINTAKNGKGDGIHIVSHAGNIDLSLRNGTVEAAPLRSAVFLLARRGSIRTRLQGTLRSTNAKQGLVLANVRSVGNGRAETGDVRVTIGEGSTLTGGGTVSGGGFPDANRPDLPRAMLPGERHDILAPVLIDAMAESGSVAIVLRPGSRAVSLRTTALFAQAAIRGRTQVGSTSAVPGDVSVTLGGSTTDTAGKKTPGAFVEVLTDGVAGVGAQAIHSTGIVRDEGTVRVFMRPGSSIRTLGASSPGLIAESITKSIDVNVAGTIATYGGIHKRRDDLAPIVRESAGVVVQTAAAGKVAVTIKEAGVVTTKGAGGDAIRVLADGVVPQGLPLNYIVTDVSGKLRTAGDGAAGIRVRLSEDEGDVRLTVHKPAVVTTGGGTLKRGGRSREAHAIDIFNERRNIDIEVAGTLSTTGQRAGGIVANTTGSIARVILRPTGRLTTSNAEAGGIVVSAKRNASMNLDGKLQTGGTDAVGIEVIAESQAYVNVKGTLTTTGARADGVVAKLRDSVENRFLAVDVSGTVAATGSGAVGLRVVALGNQPMELTILSGGSVTAETAVFCAGGGNGAFRPNRIEVNRGGSLTGSLSTGDGGELLINRGELSLRGTSRFGGGNDRFVNDNLLYPGGPGRVETVLVSALEAVDFESRTILVLDVDGVAGSADRLKFLGNTGGVTLRGIVEVNELRRPTGPGQQRFTVLQSDHALEVLETVQLRQPAVQPGARLRTRYRLVQRGNRLVLVQLTAMVTLVPTSKELGRARTPGTKLVRLVEPSALLSPPGSPEDWVL